MLIETEPLLSPPRVAGASSLLGAGRWLAWGALISVTALLVRAETSRPAPPQGVEAYTDIIYRRVGDRRVTLDLYVPKTPAPPRGRPAVIALHGGGWHGGSKNGFGRDAARLAQHGYVVASADYLLSRPDEASWPENLEDVRTAVRWLRSHAVDYDVNPNQIAALGESAGAHLAILLGTCPEDTDPPGLASGTTDPDSKEVSARVQAVISFYGPTDLETLRNSSPVAARSIVLMVGGMPHELSARCAAASPVRHVSCNAPPMLLIHGQADPLVPLDQSQNLALALHRCGVRQRLVVIAGQAHGFGLSLDGRDLVSDILAFLDAVWKDRQENP
ncbi:MAG TPA: alpha/beta hydrolase [Isosphaeraceae bacterium]|jgi:acetyl esterase/lipase|nr:alpha/beta hydrolase [Isosphaeraceae bacterium]